MINYEQELLSQTITNFQSLKSNTIKTLCLYPDLTYALALFGSNRLKENVEKYISSVFYPIAGKELAWINNAKPIYEDISYELNVLLSAQDNATFLASTDEAVSMATSQNALNLSERISLLDGQESLNLQQTASGKTVVYTKNGPFKFYDEAISVNNANITIHSKAYLVSKKPPVNSYGTISVTLMHDNGYDIKEIPTPESSVSFNNFSYSIQGERAHLLIDYDGKYFAFKVNITEASIKMGLNTDFSDKQSNAFTSCTEISDKIKTKINRNFINKDITIQNGVCDFVDSKKCIAYLLERNNEILVLENGVAFNYANTSLNYEGKARLVYENLELILDESAHSAIPESILDRSVTKTFDTIYADIIKPGYFISSNQKTSEVLAVSGNTVYMKDEISVGKDCSVTLGCYSMWKEITNKIKFVLVTFPTSIDINTINTIRSIHTDIYNMCITIKSLLESKMTRSQTILHFEPILSLRKQHLALRCRRALDVLFLGDIRYYYSLDDYSSNYELYLKQAVDEVKSRL
jgi:hypothetical protein